MTPGAPGAPGAPEMPPTTVVILAAGLGSRFGGMKQLAAVGDDGAAIMDVLIRRAAGAGFTHAVIVVAPGAVDAMRAHVDAHVDPNCTVPVELVVQRAVPGRAKPLGTAHALLAARDAVPGSFAVMNADDLYPADAFARLAVHLRDAPDAEHALVGFRVGRTLVGERPVSRALVEADARSRLVSIREGSVTPVAQGFRFAASAAAPENDASPEQSISGEHVVSMNMWGFRPPVFELLARAVAEFPAADRDGEIYLPDVVAAMVAGGAVVRVLVSEGACVGVTHPEDVDAVRAALS